MSDFSTSDELASAYLDDEVTDDERARVEADPALRARVEELRSGRDRLAAAAVDGVSSAAREAAIHAALRASPLVDLAAERSRRRMRIATIAAAIVLVLGGLGALI